MAYQSPCGVSPMEARMYNRRIGFGTVQAINAHYSQQIFRPSTSQASINPQIFQNMDPDPISVLSTRFFAHPRETGTNAQKAEAMATVRASELTDRIICHLFWSQGIDERSARSALDEKVGRRPANKNVDRLRPDSKLEQHQAFQNLDEEQNGPNGEMNQ